MTSPYSDTPDDRVEVVGEGTADGTPDVVVLDARVQCGADDVASALTDCAERVGLLLDTAADHGVAQADRRTTDVGVGPHWDREGTPSGHLAWQSVRLVVRDRERVGDVIAALAGAAGDAFGLDGVTLQVDDPAPLLRRAREAAVADARTKASDYAELVGRELGRILEIAETTGGPDGYGGGHELALAKPAPMPIEGGTTTIGVAVRVRWALR